MKKFNTKVLVFAALMASMSIVIGLVCKNYLTFGDGSVRITFENLPIILSGIWFGPIIGCAVGVIADFISALLSPPYQPNLLISLGTASIGILSGVLGCYIIKGRKFYNVLVITFFVHTVGSVIIKSIMLTIIGYVVVWPIRIAIYMGVAICEAYLIYAIVNNKGISSQIERLVKRK